MAFGLTKILKSLLIREAGTLTPKEIEIVPAGTASTKTTITGSQTANRTVTLPDATDTLTGKQTADKLENKTLLDGNNYLANTADPTKRATFDLSEIPTTKTRNFKLPDVGGDITAEIITDVGNQLIQGKTLLASATAFVSDDLVKSVQLSIPVGTGGATLTFSNVAFANYTYPASTSTLATLALAETLTNKTLTTPIIASILTNGGAATLTLPTVTDTLVGRATTDTLTNKSLSDSTTAIVDAADPTKKIILDAAGTTGTSTTILGSQTVNRTLTLPDATDTLVGKNTSDFLQNKTLSYPIVFNAFSIVDQGLDPATPAAGYKNLYGKAAGMYYRTSAGNVRQLANLDEAQVLTNKDIDGGTASNASRITVPSGTLAAITALTRKAGTILYATDTQFFYYDNGTSLIGPLVNPMTTGGDIIYGGASGVATRLANGSSGQLLTSAGGTSAPTWSSLKVLHFSSATGNPAPASVGNPIIFPTELADPSSAYDNVTGRFTVPSGGADYYEINMSYAATGGGNASWYWYKNAVQQNIIGTYTAAITGGCITVITSLLADGDIIDIRPNNTVDITDGCITFKRIGGYR